MKFIVTCKYCNHRITKEYYSKVSAENSNCEKCNSSSYVVAKEYSKVIIDTYEGSPPFPEKKTNYDDYL